MRSPSATPPSSPDTPSPSGWTSPGGQSRKATVTWANFEQQPEREPPSSLESAGLGLEQTRDTEEAGKSSSSRRSFSLKNLTRSVLGVKPCSPTSLTRAKGCEVSTPKPVAPSPWSAECSSCGIPTNPGEGEKDCNTPCWRDGSAIPRCQTIS